MNRASEFEIAAEADLQSFEMSFQRADGQKIGQRLRGMLVAAVACVDDGNQ